MKTIRVNLDKDSYDITFDNSLDALRQYIAPYRKKVLVTDDIVNKLYAKKLDSFVSAKLVLPNGEQTKSRDSLFWLYEKFMETGITRSDLIIALGGGVIGDLTGFAAATFMRGIPYIQVPTTLLAQVDSSVGGKTAIDLPNAKNIVGSFYQPKAVFIDTDFLNSLHRRTYSDGMAEVIKYGVIADRELFEMLGEKDFDRQEVVYRCCDIKRKIVERDSFDTGERMLLNFGHTIGHAVEQFYRYKKYTHGEAVAIGMYNMTLITEAMGITESGTSSQILTLLKKYGLPYKLTVRPDAVLSTIALDKKSDGDMITIAATQEIGKSKLVKISRSELGSYLNSLSK